MVSATVVLTRFLSECTIQRVAARFAKVHPTPEALAKYLQEHPKADRTKHSVKEKDDHTANPEAAPTSESTPKAPEAKAEKPSAQKAPAKIEAPQIVTPKRSGAGTGKGPIDLPGSSDEGRKKFDESVTSTRANWYKDDYISAASRVMETAGVSQAKIRSSVRWAATWNGSSSDEDTAEFIEGLANPDSFARAKYEATQAIIRSKLRDLQKRHIIDKDGYVTLYRGVIDAQATELRQGRSEDETHEVETKVRGLSSWSESSKAAEKFTDKTDVILESKVHYSRIALCWHGENADYDTLGEREWVVIGEESGKCKARMHSSGTLQSRSGGDENYGYFKYDSKKDF